MADLAALAKVSKITVSRALRDSPLVRTEVRARIQGLARAHGYRLNAAARSLRTRRAHNITAVIEMDPSTERPMSEPLALTIIGGLWQALTMRGYSLVLVTRGQMLAYPLHDTDGVILLGQGENDEATGQICRFGLPMVVWGRVQPAAENEVFLGSDNIRGGQLVGEHLAGLGRRRILFLGDAAHSEVADRFAGLSRAAAGAGADVIPRPCAFSREAGARRGGGPDRPRPGLRRHRRMQRSGGDRGHGGSAIGGDRRSRRCRGDRIRRHRARQRADHGASGLGSRRRPAGRKDAGPAGRRVPRLGNAAGGAHRSRVDPCSPAARSVRDYHLSTSIAMTSITTIVDAANGRHAGRIG